MDDGVSPNESTRGSKGPHYHGRVRTGCLTCRGRKVKCDEQRPRCKNCVRLHHQCVFKPKKNLKKDGLQQPERSHENGVLGDDSISPVSLQSPGLPVESSLDKTSDVQREENPAISEQPLLYRRSDSRSVEAIPPVSLIDSSLTAWRAAGYATPPKRLRADESTSLLYGVDTISQHSIGTSPAMSISQGIQITTTIDFLAAGELPAVSSFSYFVDSVDCPYIAPYDHQNWRWMKMHAAKLGTSNKAVAAGFLAIQALYKAQIHGLSTKNAVILYGFARMALEEFVEDEATTDFDIILVATLLLCVFEASLPYETTSIVKDPTEAYLHKITQWSSQEQTPTPLSLRIMAWIKLLHAIAIRAGGPGLLSAPMALLFSDKGDAIPSLSTIAEDNIAASATLYEILSGPIFDFYFQIQDISSRLALQTHYHRSRTSSADQEEVVDIVVSFKYQIYALWERRPSTMRLDPHDLRAQLSPEIADQLIILVRICTSACFAEILEIDRVLGYPQSSSEDSRQAMHRIREVVDEDWNEMHQDKNLSPGYLRPLFLYAIESMDRAETDWAVKRLGQIKNAICRSDFFASFAKALTDAQYSTGRRVTSKYFCFKEFGVWPPFM